MQNRKLAIALGLMGATMLSAPASAQNDQQGAAGGAAVSSEAPLSIETVTVTARRKAENLERVPVAITAVSPETIRVQNLRTAIDLQQLSPSLTVSGNLGSRDDNVFTIRGQSQPFGGADPGVQAYFNEMPFGASGPGNYFDMDNIQVLRGPQGTLFGRNTTGGAVLFQPKKPTDQFGGYLDGQVGDYAMHELQGALNIPIVDDKLMIRIAGDWNRRDGFTKDVLTGAPPDTVPTNTDLDNVSYDAFRVSMIAKPFVGFENSVVFSYLNNHNNGTGAELTSVNTGTIDAMVQAYLGFSCVGVPPGSIQACDFEYGMIGAQASQQTLGPRKTTSTIPLFYKRHVWSVSDIARYDVTEHLHLRNILGFLSDKTQSAFDYDGSFLAILEIPNSRTWEQNSRQVTEEFQVLGDTADGMWNWLAGFYYEHDYRGGYAEVERDVLGGPANVPFGETEVDAFANGGHSLAVYGTVTLDVSKWVDGLSFVAGGRYTWDHKVATGLSCILAAASPMPFCQYPLTASPFPLITTDLGADFHAPTWNLGVNWQASDDTLLYATWRRGYKSGGFNNGAIGASTSSYVLFKPEFLTDVEIGTKNNWEILGVPGRTNFDAYYGWYQDVQKNDIVNECQWAPGPVCQPAGIVVLTVNAAKATVKGIEFESTFIPDENFQVTAFYSYTDASYEKFLLPGTIDNSGMVLYLDDHAGSPFAYTPRHKIGATARIHIPVSSAYGMPYFNVTWYWQSKVWFTDMSQINNPIPANQFDFEPHAYQSDYGLVNLRLDWDSVLGSPFDASAFVNNVTNKTYKVGANALEHQIGTTASMFGAPRMFGVELRYRFGADAAE